MKKEINKTALVFDPHPDDADWWTGGLSLLLAEKRWSVHYACVGVTKPNTRSNALKAAKILGVTRHFLEIPILRNSNLQTILGKIIPELIDQIKPQLVFIPALTDYHQEHVILSRELFRFFHWSQGLGFGDMEVYAYDSSENRHPIEIFIDITSVWKTHIRALRCHRNFERPSLSESSLIYVKTGRAMMLGASFQKGGPVRFAEGYRMLQGNSRTISSLPKLVPKEFSYRSMVGLLEM